MICFSRSDLGAVALLCALTEARQPPPVDLGLVETPVIEPPQFRGSLAMKKSYVCDASRPASTTNLRETLNRPVVAGNHATLWHSLR